MGRCNATNRQGQPCGNLAMRGTTVCRIHGGKIGRVRKAARRRLDADAARRFAERITANYDHRQPIDPRDALELELWRTHVHVMLYENLVDDLDLDEGGIYGRTYHATGRPTGEAKPHVLVEMRDRERQHLAKVAVAAGQLGVEAWRAQIEQDKARLVADVFRAVFNDPELGLEPDRRRRAVKVAARHLRLLEPAADAA